MDKARVNIVYSDIDGLISISVNGEEMEDISSIRDIPIQEWFSELDDRSGWEGLIEEIYKMIGDENVELSFDFGGPDESEYIFNQCLKERGFGENALSPEEIAKNKIKDAKKAEHRGLYEEAFKFYTDAADYGKSAEAQYCVAQYCDDYINKKLCISPGEAITKAIGYYEQAAKQGYTKAGYRLFEIFFNGERVKEDYKEAFTWLNEYSDQEDSEVQLNLGVCYINGYGTKKDYKKAVKWYIKAAEQGHSDAQFKAGVCYYNGYGVEKDYEEAVKWYTKAAEQGHSDAQYNLGVCYYNGYGVEKDYEEAVKWYTKAARKKHSDAQFKLGICYENGYGVEKDIETAFKWYKIVADNPYASKDACFKLAETYYAQIDSNGNIRSGGLIAISVLIPVTNWFTIPASLVGSAILKIKKYKAFLKTDAGWDMLQYYRKAAGLGHEKAQDRVKELEKYKYL